MEEWIECSFMYRDYGYSLKHKLLTYQMPAAPIKEIFIFIIFIQLRLECIKYIKYGTSSMLILVEKLDKIVDC